MRRWRKKKSEKKKKPDSPTNVPDGGSAEIKGERGNGAAFHDHGDGGHKPVASLKSSESKQTNASMGNGAGFHDHGDGGHKAVASSKSSESKQTNAVGNGAAFQDHGNGGHKAVASLNSSESKQTNADNSNPELENSSSRKVENSSNSKTENSSNSKMENNPHLASHDSLGNSGQTAKDLEVQKNGGEDERFKGDVMVGDVQEFEQKTNGYPECDDQLVDGKNEGDLVGKSKIVEPLKDNQQRVSNDSPSDGGRAVSDSGKETKEQGTSLTASGVTERENAVSSEVLKNELPIKSPEAIIETGKGESTADGTGLPESEKEESRENVDNNPVSSEVLKNELPIKNPEAIIETGKGESTANDTGLLESGKEESRENVDKNAVSSEVPKNELPIKNPEAIIETGKGESTADDTGLPESEKEESRENVDNYDVLGLVEPTKEEDMEIKPFPSSVEVHHEGKQQVVIDTAIMDDYAHAISVKTPSEEIPEIVPFSSSVEVDQQANKQAITVDAAEKPVAPSSKDSEELKATETERTSLPVIERPTSWKGCCGMLDVFMGSNR